MSDSKDLIDKTNALLGRYRAAGAASAPANDFPILTEVVVAGRAASVPSTASTHGTVIAKSAVADDRDEIQLRALAQHLRMHLDRALETRLQELLSQELEAAKMGVTRKIQGDLDAIVSDCIQQTLKDKGTSKE